MIGRDCGPRRRVFPSRDRGKVRREAVDHQVPRRPSLAPASTSSRRCCPLPSAQTVYSSLGFVGYRIISRIKCSHLLVLFPPVPFSSFFFFFFPSSIVSPSAPHVPFHSRTMSVRPFPLRPYWKITRKATQRSFILRSCSVPSRRKKKEKTNQKLVGKGKKSNIFLPPSGLM